MPTANKIPRLPPEIWMEILLFKHRDLERDLMLSLSENEYLMYGMSPEEFAEGEFEHIFSCPMYLVGLGEKKWER